METVDGTDMKASTIKTPEGVDTKTPKRIAMYITGVIAFLALLFVIGSGVSNKSGLEVSQANDLSALDCASDVHASNCVDENPTIRPPQPTGQSSLSTAVSEILTREYRLGERLRGLAESAEAAAAIGNHEISCIRVISECVVNELSISSSAALSGMSVDEIASEIRSEVGLMLDNGGREGLKYFLGTLSPSETSGIPEEVLRVFGWVNSVRDGVNGDEPVS